MTQFVLAIDQGTTSTRAIIFNRAGQIHATAQKEHRQFFPRAGWVEHDPQEIWLNTREVVGLALARDRKSTRLNSSHVAISYAVFCLKKKKVRSSSAVHCKY